MVGDGSVLSAADVAVTSTGQSLTSAFTGHSFRTYLAPACFAQNTPFSPRSWLC